MRDINSVIETLGHPSQGCENNNMSDMVFNLTATIDYEKSDQIKNLDVSGISEVTIRNKTRKIKQKVGGEISG